LISIAKIGFQGNRIERMAVVDLNDCLGYLIINTSNGAIVKASSFDSLVFQVEKKENVIKFLFAGRWTVRPPRSHSTSRPADHLIG
jgi:hypothetical protein